VGAPDKEAGALTEQRAKNNETIRIDVLLP
jgi:hypothetical protein